MKNKGRGRHESAKNSQHKAIIGPTSPKGNLKSQAPQVGTHITNARNQLR
jgi:hypothetical protein